MMMVMTMMMTMLPQYGHQIHVG